VIVLVIDGLDTIANVFINNHRVIYSDNQFVSQAIDVKQWIHVGNDNDIRIEFMSPLLYGAQKDAEYKVELINIRIDQNCCNRQHLVIKCHQIVR
jgi:beta-mannosidase